MLNNETNGHKMTTTSAETIVRTETQTAVFEASAGTIASERKNSTNSNSNGSSSSCNSSNGDASHEYTTASTASSAANENTGKPILNQLNKYLNPPPGVHLKGKDH